MSDTAIPKSSRFRNRGGLSGPGSAGPRRLLIIGVSGIAIAAVIAAVVFQGKSKPATSLDARMQVVNPNPGGLNSDQEQNALAMRANDTAANTALAKGTSYTPPIAPSVPVVNQTPAPPPSVESAAPLPPPHFVPHAPLAPPPPPLPVAAAATPILPPPLPGTVDAQPAAVQVADYGGVSDPQQQTAYTTAINQLFTQWDGRAPVTDVILPPPPVSTASAATGGNGGSTDQTSAAGDPKTADPDPTSAPQKVLIPAGRGIFAHPILALSSDASSPVVLQADSGPIAGDRMIGSFSRQGDRLIIDVNEIIHNGQSINCSGVVIAPDTMEAAVASGVDQHYIARFALPAAAAFVEGLGNAIETTSNQVQVLSPLGGATTATNLNFHQQLGVAAGAAAQQIGNTLNQDAPKGPTVTLDANVSVGVMFISDVKAPSGT